jgi:paraquat-inducible protein B
MKLKYLAQTALAAAIVCTSSVTTEAQIFQDGFQSQNVVIVQQPTEEDMAKVDIGADLYDAGIGVGVRSVFTNGPAQMAGLQSGDMLTKANGEAIQNLAVFKAMVQGKAAGESVKLTRSKDGKEDEVEVKLATMADIMKASNVPEPSAYDQAVQQAEQQISSLKQQIENAKADLEDMAKRLADQEKQLGELKTKAAEAKVAAEKQKAADAAKKAADEAKAKEAAAAAEAANKAAQPQPEAVEGDKQ